MRGRGRYRVALLALGLFLSLPAGARGIIALRHDLEVEGFVQSQNIVRTPRFRDAELILQRNTAQLETTWRFIQERRTTIGDFSPGPIEEASFKAIYRFVYDSTYDIRDSFRDKFSVDERDTLKFENWLREVYVDLAIPPLTLRLGRQQVVWGETDTFRALDVINPLDSEWHWSREPWEDIRIPLWMVRGIYDIGGLGWLEESFIEGIWIPGDFQRSRISPDSRRPWGFFGGRRRERANSVFIGEQLTDLMTVVRDHKPDRALESSELGVRFKAVWGQVDFGLHYFWTLSDTTGVKIRNELVRFEPNVGDEGTLTVPIDLVNPRSHVVGVAANYSEEYFTQTVFRVETTYTTGIPVRLGTLQPSGVPRSVDQDRNNFMTAEQTLLMLAFDRPTWIRPLNKLRTFFLTGQFFWQHYTDFNRFFRGTSSVRRALDPTTREIIPGRFVGVNTDRLTEDQVVATLAASTSYGPGGLIQPLVALAYNPLDTTFFHRLSVDYLFSNHLIFRLTHDFYWGKSVEEPWFIGGRFGGAHDNRTETVFTIIFQF